MMIKGMTVHLGAVLTLLCAVPVLADSDLRDICPTRPGLATPPCIVDSGHVLVELSGVDWTIDQQGSAREETALIGDLIVRLGVDRMSEIEIGFTPFGPMRRRDDQLVERTSGPGDVTLALKRSLQNPDGSGVSIAVQPYAIVPTGGKTIGAGDWGVGFLIPMSFALSDKVHIMLTPEIDGAVDEDREGRHLAYGTIGGVEIELTTSISTVIELSMMHDDDPDGAETEALAALSFAWQPADDWQLDIGGAVGLNQESPNTELYFGVSRRF
jgi:hypothetical protein